MPDSFQRLSAQLHMVLDDVRPIAQELAPPASVEAAPDPLPPLADTVILARPWSLAAAMETLPPAPAVRRAPVVPAPEAFVRTYSEPRRWPVIAAVAVALVALAVFGIATARWVHLGTTPGAQATKPAKPAAALLVPVTGPATNGTPAAAPTTHFPGGTRTVYVSVRVAQGGASPVLTFWVALQTDGATPDTHVVARTFVLAAGSAAVVPIAAPAGYFAPGTYTVTAAMDGAAVGSTNFVVG